MQLRSCSRICLTMPGRQPGEGVGYCRWFVVIDAPGSAFLIKGQGFRPMH